MPALAIRSGSSLPSTGRILRGWGFARVAQKAAGRAGYPPVDLLKRHVCSELMMEGRVRRIGHQVAAGLLLTMPALGAESPAASVEVIDAWTPASAQTRADTPIYMTIANRSDVPDSLVRARCPVANFVEKHATDRGEGGYAMREIKAIPIPAGGTVKLEAHSVHLMLLQTTQVLQKGETFTCSVVFQKAGTMPVEVTVAPDGVQEN